LGVMQHNGLIAEPQDPAIAAYHPVFRLKKILSFLKMLFCSQSNLAVFGVDVGNPVHRIGEPLYRRETQHVFNLWAYLMPASVNPKFCDVGNGGKVLPQCAIATLGSAEFGLDPVALDGNACQMSGVGDEL